MPFAMEQAHQTGARLTLLHVIAANEAMSADLAGMPYYDPTGVLESAANILEYSCESARRHGIACSGLVREGNAAKQVLEAAHQLHADRIVLGTRSRSKLSKLLLGSVAEQVLRSVNLPVITVGPEARLPVEGNTDVVLHATTLGETSRPSAALACQIASILGANLVLLHVLPPTSEMERSGLPAGLDSAAMKELGALADSTAEGCPICVAPHVVHGNPAIEILAEAEDRHARLIVMGSTARSGFQSLTRDRTVYKVLAHAHCPVMTLREAQVTSEENLLMSMATHS
jgi:nucleotide-binding universal stress UspA family protein